MRLWWQLGGTVLGSGAISKHYHRVYKAENRTACGIRLGESYAIFVDGRHAPYERTGLRCPECVQAEWNKICNTPKTT